jgi:hypothetical protein
MKARLAILLLLILSACGSSRSPYSDYYVVSFDPAGAELPPAGRAALSYAARDADRGAPRAVAVKGYVSVDGSGRELSEQRMKVVAEALVEAGVPRSIIHLTPQPTPTTEFTRLGNGVVVQIERGNPVVAAPAAIPADQ